MTGREQLEITVNGVRELVAADVEDTLLDVLRRELGLFSARETCGIGVCGACTVLVDGRAVSSCLSLALARPGVSVTTSEGLIEDQELHPVQRAFVEAQAFQCSFCTPGFVMSVVAMLREPPEQRSVEGALSGHLCRCASYSRVLEAVRQVVGTCDHGQEA